MAQGQDLREQRWVVMNDLQIPFEDKPVLWELVVPFVRELKPYGVVPTATSSTTTRSPTSRRTRSTAGWT